MLDEQEQNLLATRIWGRTSNCDQLIWERGVLPNNEQGKPLTVSRVVSDLGLPSSPQQIHRLAVLVHRAYIRLYGVAPRARIFYNDDGIPERLCCFTEEDRELIMDTVYDSGIFNEPSGPTINPPC